MAKKALVSVSMFVMLGSSIGAQLQVAHVIDTMEFPSGTGLSHLLGSNDSVEGPRDPPRVESSRSVAGPGPLPGPGLIVLAALHGSGSTMLSSAMNRHPCIISIGEPFGGNEYLYAPDHTLKGDERALFGNNSKPQRSGTYEKLNSKLSDAMDKTVKIKNNLQMESGNFLDFFKSIRAQACDAYDLPEICDRRCLLAHKLFPDYIANDFQVAEQYLMSEDVAVIHLHRNEEDLAESNARRFHRYRDNKMDRDDEWNHFLVQLEARSPASKIWREVSAERIFQGPGPYVEEVDEFFHDMQLDYEDIVQPVRDFIAEQFEDKSADHFAR